MQGNLGTADFSACLETLIWSGPFHARDHPAYHGETCHGHGRGRGHHGHGHGHGHHGRARDQSLHHDDPHHGEKTTERQKTQTKGLVA